MYEPYGILTYIRNAQTAPPQNLDKKQPRNRNQYIDQPLPPRVAAFAPATHAVLTLLRMNTEVPVEMKLLRIQ